MTNKRPVAIDHTHEPSQPTYDGFQSKEDKTLIDLLRVDKVKYDNSILTTKEPTGFTNNQNITVSYDSTTRKITLSGTFDAYYQGVRVRELIDGWVSQAHADVQGTYFLYYCDSGFVFSTTPWEFSCLQIAFVQYNSHIIGMREVHGFMPNSVHQELHSTLGTYKSSGGDFSDYTLNSNTATLRRPVVSNTVVADEDLLSTVLTLTSKLYTQRYLTGSAVRSFNMDQAEIVAVSGSQPYYNLNTGGTWSQALFANNSYGAVFVVAVPTTNDAGSQKYRYMFVQPQLNSASLSDIQSLTPNSLVHGTASTLVSEFVFIGKIIIRYTGGDWSITQVDKLEGTRIAQVSVNANGLSIVSHDTNFTGDGTTASPLALATEITTTRERLTSTEDASLSSTLHALQTGLTSGANMIFDTNEIMARNNGAGADLYLNADGAKVRIAENLSYGTTTNPTVYGNYIAEKGGTSLSAGYWVKFYDGTMILYFVLTFTGAIATANTTVGGYESANATTINFPQDFINTNYSALFGEGNGCLGAYVNTKAVGSLTCFLRNIISSASGTRVIPLHIIGRWY